MYIYILLAISGLTAAVEDRLGWSFWGDFINVTHNTYVPEDARLNIAQLAIKYNHPIEEHAVTTEDGYIIHMHRMPARSRSGKPRPVVFLMHGILESSDSWLLLGPEKGLAFVLSNSGFDVWMGNARGNKHALNHVTLVHSMRKFWDFTWEELALYDLPAMIDYVLEETGQESLYYIGHSQGTTTGYVMCSMKPEYNKKIRMMFSLAPAAWMGNIRSPLVKIFAPTYNILGLILNDLNAYTASMSSFNKLSAVVCSFLPGNCDNILLALSGHETKIDNTFLSVIFGHTPTGASTRQFVHYGQLVQSHRFCRFNYGAQANIMKYGQSTPPDYDLSQVAVPVVIFYSSKDWVSDPKDVATLISHLPNVYDHIYLDDFTHIDYIYAKEAVDRIYNKIIGFIFKYEESHHFSQRPPSHNVYVTQNVSPSDSKKSRADGNLKNMPTIWC